MKTKENIEDIILEKIKELRIQAYELNTKLETYNEILEIIVSKKEDIEEIKQVSPETPQSPYRKSMAYTPSERYELTRPIDKHRQPWSKADIEYLKELSEQKKEIKEISDLMGRTPFAVIKRMDMMGMRRKRKYNTNPWTKQDTDMAKGMYIHGFSPTQISERLKREPKSVANKLFNLKRIGEL